MNYLKTFVINFLIVFFANHTLAGILVTDLTKLPHFGADMMVAAALGLLNALIYPILRLFKQVSLPKILLVSMILNFGAYAVIKLAPVGVKILSVEGYIFASLVTSLGAFITNWLEMKRHPKKEDPFH